MSSGSTTGLDGATNIQKYQPLNHTSTMTTHATVTAVNVLHSDVLHRVGWHVVLQSDVAVRYSVFSTQSVFLHLVEQFVVCIENSF